MIVSGNVKGLKKGTLYLQHLADTTLVVVDSLKVDGDGNFRFETELEGPEMFYLYLNKKDDNDINDRIAFFAEPGTITINTAWNTFDTNSEVKGSKTHDKWKEYLRTMTQFNKKNLAFLQASIDPKNPLDSLQLDSLQKLSDKNVQRGYAFALNFALNNLNSAVAPYIAVTDVADANVKYLDSISNSLSPEVAETKYGRKLKKYLEDIKK
ncbi:MAG: DUF4369 domain-containing protein [Flavobacteriaceae bacterium]